MKLKNFVLSLGTIGTIVAPLATVIACGDEKDKEDPTDAEAGDEGDGGTATETGETTADSTAIAEVIKKLGTPSIELKKGTNLSDDATREKVIDATKTLIALKENLTAKDRKLLEPLIDESKLQMDLTTGAEKAVFTEGEVSLKIAITIAS